MDEKNKNEALCLTSRHASEALSMLELYISCSTKYNDEPVLALARAIDQLGTKEVVFAERVNELGIYAVLEKAAAKYARKKINGMGHLFSELRTFANRLKKLDELDVRSLPKMRDCCEAFYDELLARERSIRFAPAEQSLPAHV
ncbi:MAG TPA: hypothetical protein VHD38_02615 [Candidatus Paceibacterota bacterium]|nr:hypothetical protein [Candidatus Paceibacterota bacterium]